VGPFSDGSVVDAVNYQTNPLVLVSSDPVVQVDVERAAHSSLPLSQPINTAVFERIVSESNKRI